MRGHERTRDSDVVATIQKPGIGGKIKALPSAVGDSGIMLCRNSFTASVMMQTLLHWELLTHNCDRIFFLVYDAISAPVQYFRRRYRNRLATYYWHLVEVTPTKARRTQKDEVKYLIKFRELIGENDIASFKPHYAYAIRDHIKSGVTKGSGEKQSNRHMSVLKHVFTKSIEWGLRETHTMHNGVFKMFPEKKSNMRIPTEEEVREAMKIANPMLQAYCKLKLQTDLRLSDMLSLTVRNITLDALEVTPRKTEDRTDETISFVMTPELREVIKEVRTVPPLNSIYLFKNHRRNRGLGEALIKSDGTTTGFDS